MRRPDRGTGDRARASLPPRYTVTPWDSSSLAFRQGLDGLGLGGHGVERVFEPGGVTDEPGGAGVEIQFLQRLAGLSLAFFIIIRSFGVPVWVKVERSAQG
jgi:hypothetical protein